MGEYARCLAIARAVSRRWREAAIHFVLSSAAPYATDVPFATTLLDASPTFHSAAVVELIEAWRPDVVIFDSAGRTAQLRAAQRLGARIVYISARRRQRRKAFRRRWMSLIDEHWIAYPQFIAGSLNFLERLKLKIAGRPTLRYLDVILPQADPARREAILARAGCVAGAFVLVVPGGGTGHPGADDAAGRFEAAARALAAAGTATVYVGPSRASGVGAQVRTAPNWHPLGSLPQSDLAELMRAARLVIANGGSTLLQAIACGNACVAAAIAKDQPARIRRCVASGVALASRLDAGAMVQAANRLLQHEEERAALKGRAAALGLADGLEVALQALAGLLPPAQRAEAT
jgi:spore coat polysaccharide biosynthesis predicted glycosyltransferase SpsG